MASRLTRHWIAVAISLYATAVVMGAHAGTSFSDVSVKKYGVRSWSPVSSRFPTGLINNRSPLSSVAASSSSSSGRPEERQTDAAHRRGNGNHVLDVLTKKIHFFDRLTSTTARTKTTMTTKTTTSATTDKRKPETTDKPKVESTTQDRAIITAPEITCPSGQQMGPNRVCRPTFKQDNFD